MADQDLTGFGLPLPPPKGRTASTDRLAELLRRVQGLKAANGLPPTVQPQRRTPLTQKGVIQEPGRVVPQPGQPQVQTPTQQTPQTGRIAYKKVFDPDPRKPVIRRLISAFARQSPPQVVEVGYRTVDNKFITRQVEPYEIVTKRTKARGPATYLYARCAAHGTTHSFLLSGIQTIQGTGRTYTPQYQVRL